MKTKTVNILVREKLLSLRYPIHYYLPVLHYALTCLDELSQYHNFGGNVKELKITATNYGRVVLPSDVVDVIDVYALVAGERKDFKYNSDLTIIQKFSGVTPVPWLETDTSLPEYNETGSSALLEQTSSYEYPTIFYPSDQVDYEYNIDLANSQVVLGPRVDTTEIYVRYLSSGASGTVVNLVHPYAVAAIHAYIDYQISESERRAQSETMRKRDEYYNERRLLRGKMNPLSVSQLYEILVTS